MAAEGVPFAMSPQRSSFSIPDKFVVRGVTLCENTLFVVLQSLQQLGNTILVIGQNNEQETEMALKDVKNPSDIVACAETRQLYVADDSPFSGCVWRVSLDGSQVFPWLPNNSTTASRFRPFTLSVTSRRLLISSHVHELLLYGDDGVEMRRISLPGKDSHHVVLQHAVETPRGTFVVCQQQWFWNWVRPRVYEVDVNGHVISEFRDEQRIGRPVHLSLGSDGRVFVADYYKHQILILNSRLELERQQQHESPWRLCYSEKSDQLVVGSSFGDVQTFPLRQLIDKI